MLKKLFLWVLLFALITAICVVSANYFLKPFLKEKILETAERGLGGGISLSAFDISLLKGVLALKDVKIENCRLLKYCNSIAADKIVIDIDLPYTILSKSAMLNEIYVKNFEFNLENRRLPPYPVEIKSVAAENVPAELNLPRLKNIFNRPHIQKLSIENSRFVFTDHSLSPLLTVTEIEKINGRIEDITLSFDGNKTMRGIAHLSGRLNSESEGPVELDGSFMIVDEKIDFDLELDLGNTNLVEFSPYYSNTSFAVLKSAKLDLYSKAVCRNNDLDAFQKARIYDIELYDAKPNIEDTLFGLPAKTVIDFFEKLKNDIEFDFSIAGTIYDPRFTPGPMIKQILFNAIRDKIIARLQELPREVIQKSGKAINE